MTDNRFDNPGVDNRFPSPGVDTRFDTPGVDNRFPSPGIDTRFTLSAPSGPTITAPGSAIGSTFKIGVIETVTPGTAIATGGGSITYEFQHLVNGLPVSIAAGYAYLASADTQAGVRQWRAVEAGGSNDGATPWQTVASGTITYPAPTNTVAPSVTGSTGLGDTLSALTGTWTGGGLIFGYRWQRNGVNIPGATSDTYTITLADDAASLRCVITATNSGGSVPANSNAVIADDFAVPSITGVPTISGTEAQGSILTATAASVSGNPAPSGALQWKRDGAPILGATGPTYTLQASDVGATLTVVQTETNALGSDSAESAATGVISSGNTAPSISGVPTISGGAVVGQVLTATAAAAGGNPAPTTTWQWKRGGVNIAGATNNTYALVSADLGALITVEQTETNVAGSDSATSAPTNAVTDVPLAITSYSFNEGTGQVSFNLNRAATVFWSTTIASEIDAADIEAAVAALDSGSDAITPGANNLTWTFPTTTGNHYLNIVAKDGSGYSNVISNQYDFQATDTTPPSISGGAPGDDATGVAIDAKPTAVFDENVQFAASGSIILYDDTGAANFEVFDVSTDVGSGPGSVSISGATLTIEPTNVFAYSNGYSIQFSGSPIEDLAGNALVDINDSTTYNFTTVAGGGGTTPVAATFDGSADFIEKGAAFSNETDSTNLMFYADIASTDGYGAILQASSGALGFYIEGNHLYIQLKDASNAFIVQRDCADANLGDGNPHEIFVSYDGVAGTLQVYIDGTDASGTGGTLTTGTVDVTRGNWAIGAQTNGQNKFAGDMARVALWTGASNDLSIAGNRAEMSNPDTSVTGGTKIMDVYTEDAVNTETTFNNQAGTGLFEQRNGAF